MSACLNRLAGSVADANYRLSMTERIWRVMWALHVRRERRTLLSLDDHILKDIGLTRSEAQREGNRSLFDLPERSAAECRGWPS